MTVSGSPSRECITVYASIVAGPAASVASASSRRGMASIWSCG